MRRAPAEILRQEAGLNAANAIRLAILASQNRQHAGHFQSAAPVDPNNVGMSPCGIDDMGMTLALKPIVVRKAALSADKAMIFPAQDRLTDSVFHDDIPRWSRAARLSGPSGAFRSVLRGNIPHELQHLAQRWIILGNLVANRCEKLDDLRPLGVRHYIDLAAGGLPLGPHA